ncbi:MAG TPA: hypothetical protein VK646_08285 [Actinomycetota bacterium]|nr:hypothetical protein [Actinomycetota bacterium]
MGALAEIVPQIHGFLEVFFLGLLALLVVLVGIFAVFVIVQQFRNPGRPAGHP